MRVVLLSQYVTALRGMVRVCRAQGHQPVAAICTRARSPHGARVSPDMAAMAKAIVSACPPGVSVSVVDGRDALCEIIERHAPDLLLVRGFPWRLPLRALTVAPYGSVNLHPSCLPRLRGPFPVHRAILAGDTTLGVTAHRMDEDFDTGALLATERFDVAPDDFGATVWAHVDRAAERALAVALERVAAGEPGERQEEQFASYAAPFDEGDSVVDWTRTAREIHNQVRAWSLGSLGAEGPVADLSGTPVRVLRTSLTAIDAPRVSCADRPIWLAEHAALPSDR